MTFSEHDTEILLTFQRAKRQWDGWFVACGPSDILSKEFNEEMAKQHAYWDARFALQNLEHPDLQKLVQRVFAQPGPGFDSSTKKGRVILEAAEKNRDLAEHELLKISVGIKDLFPLATKFFSTLN
jgi:hypothetical protein